MTQRGTCAPLFAYGFDSTACASASLYIHVIAESDDLLIVQDSRRRWLPAMRSDEAVARHIAFVKLDGRELAVWRDDDGALNAWENRCPHRGTRLTIGVNTGREVSCRYHGWRFRTQSGACTAIPAHPGQTPPRAARVATYAATERDGLIWVHLGEPGDGAVPHLADGPLTPIRSVAVDAPRAAVVEALRRLAAGAAAPNAAALSLMLVVAPQDAASSMIHGAVAADLAGDERIAVLRRVNDTLKRVRRSLDG